MKLSVTYASIKNTNMPSFPKSYNTPPHFSEWEIRLLCLQWGDPLCCVVRAVCASWDWGGRHANIMGRICSPMTYMTSCALTREIVRKITTSWSVTMVFIMMFWGWLGGIVPKLVVSSSSNFLNPNVVLILHAKPHKTTQEQEKSRILSMF